MRHPIKTIRHIIISALLGFGCMQSALAIETGPFQGEVVPENWQPTGIAAEAEKMWWQVFQSQDYTQTPALYEKLYKAVSSCSDEYSRVLMNGRLGWFYLWITSELKYAQTPAKDLLQTPGLAQTVDLYAINKAAIANAKSLNPTAPDKLLGILTAVHYFSKASSAILKTIDPELIPKDPGKIPSAHDPFWKDNGVGQLQDWTQIQAPNWQPEPVIPWKQGPTPNGTYGLSWRTFPGVVTGFTASFDGFPHGAPKPLVNTYPEQETEAAISYSLGFNFATNVLGHVAGHRLDANDADTMWMMMRLAANPSVQATAVFGTGEQFSYQDKLFTAFWNKYGHLAPEGNLSSIWNPVKDPGNPQPGETPANIVKASSGSSTVVPFNYENNFLLLGDSLFAGSHKPATAATKSTPASPASPPDASTLKLIKAAYSWATQSASDAQAYSPDPATFPEITFATGNIFQAWPFKRAVAERLSLIDNPSPQNLASLYEYTQNNTGSRAPCMICHMRSAD